MLRDVDDLHDGDDMKPPPIVFGYRRCRGCGALVIEQFAVQSEGHCADCWKDRQPLAALEVRHGTMRQTVSHKKRNRLALANVKKYSAEEIKARTRAWTRLADVFPDVFDMLYDEERVKAGLPPVARFEPHVHRVVASKTLDFLDVYSALDSIGERCASDDVNERQAETS
jgi:hypothetical protein